MWGFSDSKYSAWKLHKTGAEVRKFFCKYWCTRKLDHIYLPAHYETFMVWVASAIIWKTERFSRFQIHKWDIIWKQEETALDSPHSHCPISPNILNPRSLFGVTQDPSPSSLRKVRWKGSWSTQRGLWVSQMGLFRQWKVGQKLLNYCWWQPEIRWTHQLRLVVEILLFSSVFTNGRWFEIAGVLVAINSIIWGVEQKQQLIVTYRVWQKNKHHFGYLWGKLIHERQTSCTLPETNMFRILEMVVSNRDLIFQWSIFRGYVS